MSIKTSSRYARGGIGKGVTFGLLDSGATPEHPDLAGNYVGSVAEKGEMTERQANWCQCSRWESGRREKASHHLHPRVMGRHS